MRRKKNNNKKITAFPAGGKAGGHERGGRAALPCSCPGDSVLPAAASCAARCRRKSSAAHPAPLEATGTGSAVSEMQFTQNSPPRAASTKSQPASSSPLPRSPQPLAGYWLRAARPSTRSQPAAAPRPGHAAPGRKALTYRQALTLLLLIHSFNPTPRVLQPPQCLGTGQGGRDWARWGHPTCPFQPAC